MCEPTCIVEAVILQTPPDTVVVPIEPSRLDDSEMVSPFVPVPENVGVVSLVKLSVFDEPLSLDAAKSGALGALGAFVSMVIIRAEDETLSLLLASVAFAVMACVAADNALTVIDQLPSVAVAEPITVLPDKSLKRRMVLPDSAVPLNVGVVSVVKLSEEDAPVSELEIKSGVLGASGATSSDTVMVNAFWKLVVPS